MHELAIAQQLCDAAKAALPTAEAQVSTMTVRLGPLAGVSKDELAFGFEVMSRGTVFDGAHLEIEEVPAVVRCDACQAESQITDPNLLACPACGATTVQVVQGRELILQSIEVVDD